MQLLPLRSVDRPISSVALCIDRAVETSNFLKQLHGIVCHCKDCESRRAVGEETTNALLHDDEHGGAFETRHPLLYQTHPDDRQIQAKIPKARKKKDRKIENEQWEEILTALFSAEVRRFRRTFQLPQKRSDTTSRIEKPCRWHKGKPVIIMNHGSMDASDKIMYPTSPLDNYPQQQDQPWPCAAARAGRSATNAEIENGGSLTRLSSVVHSGRFVFGAHSAQLRQCLLEQPGYEMALDDIYRWFRENTDRDHGTLDALEEARQFNPYMVSRHGTIEEVAEKHGKAAGEEYKKLLEKAAGLRKGWQCGVRHNLSQNKGAFRRVEGQKGYWRLTPAGVISVESTTSYRKDRESKNHSPSRAKAKRELSESERRKRQEAGAKGGHASANSRRVHDKQKQQAARRSKRTRGQPVNYNEDAIMMTPDMSMDMQLDFGAYPDSYSGQGNHAFDMSRFDDMRSNSGTSSGTPPLIQSTTPSSLSNTATPPQGAYDSLFHQDYSGFDFSDMTMDSNMFSNMGYHEVSAELNANYQPATYDTWPSEHPTSSQGYSTNSQPTAAATNNGMADSNSTPPYTSAFSSNGNDMYQPFSLYNNYDPYQSSNIMPAFSHTASLPGDLPGASPGLDNGYLTTPASSGGMLTANDGTMGRAQSRRMRVHGPGRLNRAQQPPRMNGYAPNVPSGLSRANTPAPSPEVVGGYVDLGKEMQTDDVQMRAVESENDAIDPQLFFHEWSSEGMVDLSGTGSAVSTAERRDHMEYVLGGQH